MKILITGIAGFIGYHLAQRLAKTNNKIFGIDNLNDYYSVKLKKDRLKELDKNRNKITFFKKDLSNKIFIEKLFKKHKFDIVVNLAAQAGVRYSIDNPDSYIQRNIIGFFNILEASKKYKIKHLIYASTSSVYGNNKSYPLKENLNTNKPLQLYAATKLANELMAHSYSSLFNLQTTGLRFFTVYGPWGRPDMALFLFTKNIISGEPIKLFNRGNHTRDFTYVEDIASGIEKIILSKNKTKKKYNIFNIGSGKPIHLIKYLGQIEKCLKLKAKVVNLPLQMGDIVKTHGSTEKIKKFYKYKPETNYKDGIKNFIDWYKAYFKY
ncbi:SDR family NAD(P)-dependent oxidoreductase [Candidatus Pelagibacter sp.]|jgi:UDP-glucuronate 4-epimerase|nr:SDR family NAD(P)-dependent oxidoreductase [Candidatus Pelagibacter sp.]